MRRTCLSSWAAATQRRRAGRRQATLTSKALGSSWYLECTAALRMCFSSWRLAATVIEDEDDERKDKGHEARDGHGRKVCVAHRHLPKFRERAGLCLYVAVMRELRRSCWNAWDSMRQEAILLKNVQDDRLAAEELVVRYANEATSRCQVIETRAERQIAEMQEEAEALCRQAEDLANSKGTSS